jgi:hypothetical protein
MIASDRSSKLRKETAVATGGAGTGIAAGSTTGATAGAGNLATAVSPPVLALTRLPSAGAFFYSFIF